MKTKLLFIFTILTILFSVNLSAQAKYALVIGNGNYAHFPKLTNPENDANDIAQVLQSQGFTVDRVVNGTLEQMETAVTRLRNRLSVDNNSYGFFFFAGHGVQSGGDNFLIPVDASINSESALRMRAVAVQTMLDDLNQAGNALNVVVLDACRDIPAAWTRSLNRGLAVVSRQPADSIIVYATSAGSVASDGTGRNGLFTTHFLTHLRTPGLEVKEIFNRTGADVARASGNQQRPAIYSQFFETAYLGSKPEPVVAATPAAATPQPATQPTPAAQQPASAAATPQPAAQPRAGTPNVQHTYFIGDIGPAGGIIFYDQGRIRNGWRYLEAAPEDLERTQWEEDLDNNAAFGINIRGTKTGIGTGKSNTELIITELKKNNRIGTAAKLCNDYSLNGYNDWFLPSRDELKLIYKNLKENGFGNFENITYWSSSQNSNIFAWGVRFDDGSQYTSYKNGNGYVRPIRAF